jgi:hypothetical protein
MNGHNDPDVFSDPIPVSTDYLLAADPTVLEVCSPADGVAAVNVLQFQGFTEPVTLAAGGVPTGASASFVPNPVAPAGSSVLTISGTGGAAAGSYPMTVTGTSSPSAVVHATDLTLELYSAAPGAVDLLTPIDGALNQPLRPAFSWTAAVQGDGYRLQVATDPGFTTVVLDVTGIADVVYAPGADLASNTVHYWRVVGENACGPGPTSAVFSFITEALPGDCGLGTVASDAFVDDLESGAPGWALGSGGSGNTWALSGARFHSGAMSYHAVDPTTTSDQRLDTPPIALPTGVSPVTLQFWNWQLMEDRSGGCYDGGEVEISVDGGTVWTPLPTAVMLTDPYDGPVTGLGNLDGWCDDLGAAATVWKKAVADVSAYAGQTARFRFQLGSDSSVDREGWYIDDIKVQSCMPDSPPFFADGFESGTTAAWAQTVP